MWSCAGLSDIFNHKRHGERCVGQSLAQFVKDWMSLLDRRFQQTVLFYGVTRLQEHLRGIRKPSKYSQRVSVQSDSGHS